MLRVGALMTSLLLCSFVVLAQDDWQELLGYSSMGEMARQMMIEKEKSAELNEPAHSNLSHFVVEEEPDRELQLENWMTDAGFFNDFNFEEETDAQLPVENWMSSDVYFRNLQVEETDRPLELEIWMTDSQFWKDK